MRRAAAIAFTGVAIISHVPAGEAHKPITSPYTFTEDVLPILRQHCGRCHVTGGAAPMSLLTHEAAVPWAESIRLEFLSGHMPPWDVETSPSRFQGAGALVARELNVLLTWAVGGTPRGGATPPAVAAVDRNWPLGEPDAVFDLPPYTIGADEQEHVEEVTVRTGTREARWIRAADLLPGEPAIVRSASVTVRERTGNDRRRGLPVERLLALWVPGLEPAALEGGAAIEVPAGAELTVRIRYRKTWRNERETLTDRSRVGLYFAQAPATSLRTLMLAPSPSEIATLRSARRVTFTRSLERPLTALAVRADAGGSGSRIAAYAVRPDGSRDELIALRPRSGWERRYWYRSPIALPPGTRIEITATLDDESALLPPGSAPPGAARPEAVRVTFDVIEGTPAAAAAGSDTDSGCREARGKCPRATRARLSAGERRTRRVRA